MADALAIAFIATLFTAHLISIGLALFRVTRASRNSELGAHQGVSVIRPVCGLEEHDGLTLRSSFALTHPLHEVIFCCASSSDVVLPALKDFIARKPAVDAKIILGDERPTRNPKLNNLMKGWTAAKHPWIVLSDSNVLLPEDYIEVLFASLKDDTGLVCSPPAGCLPESFAAEVECAFLNSYQARWQLAADTIGLGFAQGKSMLWKRELLDQAGGLEALAGEVAEDAAATKLVRRMGLRVRLVDRPFSQPLGRRSAAQVWSRQLRWARLRRASFAEYFAPEIFSGIVPVMVAGSLISDISGAGLPLFTAALLVSWYLPEAILTQVAGWHFSKWAPLAWVVRDCIIPVVWIAAWIGDEFSWRGNRMSVAAATVETPAA